MRPELIVSKPLFISNYHRNKVIKSSWPAQQLFHGQTMANVIKLFTAVSYDIS